MRTSNRDDENVSCDDEEVRLWWRGRQRS